MRFRLTPRVQHPGRAQRNGKCQILDPLAPSPACTAAARWAPSSAGCTTAAGTTPKPYDRENRRGKRGGGKTLGIGRLPAYLRGLLLTAADLNTLPSVHVAPVNMVFLRTAREGMARKRMALLKSALVMSTRLRSRFRKVSAVHVRLRSCPPGPGSPSGNRRPWRGRPSSLRNRSWPGRTASCWGCRRQSGRSGKNCSLQSHPHFIMTLLRLAPAKFARLASA